MNKLTTIKKSKGVTLIEVLAAVIITSIGILGFTSLQFLGLNSNQSAFSRSQASYIATSLSERMRANMDGVDANAYFDLDSETDVDCETMPTPYCDARNNAGTAVAANGCNSTQLAAFDFFVTVCGASSNDYTDLSERTDLLTDLLPSGTITVQCNDSDAGVDSDDCTDASDHTITVSWQEQDEDATFDAADNPDSKLRTIARPKSVIYVFNP